MPIEERSMQKKYQRQDSSCTIRRIFVKRCRFWYLDVSVISQEPQMSEVEIPMKLLKFQITKALKQLFGEAGAAASVDIMKYNSATRRAVLRCPAESYVKLRSSLTLITECGESKCLLKVHKVSASLLSLLANSRTFKH